MKTNYQILDEAITCARKLGHLDCEKERIKKLSISSVAPRDDKNLEQVFECKMQNSKSEQQQKDTIADVETQILIISERLNTFLWLNKESED